MSNKSGTSNQVISLPQGGGALQGLGEKFSPDLHTGTGNFSVPIALPPGRNGFQPTLNLSYSTGNGSSAFGLGWSLAVPGISRKTAKGLPKYDDAQDTFILSGAEDLVLIEQVPGISRYRPRTEGLFARIEHHYSTQHNFWKVWSKDGLVSFYGTERPIQADAGWQDPAAIAHPEDPTQIFAWKLSRTVDPFGNRIEYDYERDTRTGRDRTWNELYLKRIRYVDYDEADETRFLVSVTLEYAERPDAFSDHRAGFEIRTRKRCQRLVVQTHADQDYLTRTYELIYLDQRTDLDNLDALLPLNRASLLSQVRVVGHDGDRSEALPPLEFSYTRFKPQGRKFLPVQGELPTQSLASANLELADLFGNGLPDLVEMNGSIRYWRNLGNGKFDRPREMRTAPSGVHLADSGVQLIDANGDGRIDLLVSQGNLAGYYSLRFDGTWDSRSFQRYSFAPSFNLEDPEVKLVDLDGDGVTDALRSGSSFECFFNHPEAGWHATRRVERRSLESFPNVSFSDPRVKWADMNGDGLQDIVLVHDGKIEYWPNLGYGNWGQRVTMPNSPRFRYGYDPRHILLGDVDGDGVADLIYVDDRMVVLWINQHGNGWSDPIEIKGTPAVTDIDAVRLVDLLGTGISGILWSRDRSSQTRNHLFFLDLTGGVKPYLLNQMDNHRGAVTHVEYASSVQFYLADEQQADTRWKTPLPFPVQVVSKVEVFDQLSQGKLTTVYHYHHGYWDGAEREFRGFGRVEQLDSEIFADSDSEASQRRHFTPPMLTKTWFHQGPVGEAMGEWQAPNYRQEFWSDDPPVFERLEQQTTTTLLQQLPRRARRDALRSLRSRVLRTEVYALDGSPHQNRPYTVTEFFHTVATLPIGNAATPLSEWQQRVFFPHTVAERTTQWERGQEPMTQFQFMGDYDAYGQPQQQTQIACPRDWRIDAHPTSDAYLVTHSQTRFVQRDDRDRYIVDRVAVTTTYEGVDSRNLTVFELKVEIEQNTAALKQIGQTLHYYDGSAFTGLPLHQIGDYGALVRTETLTLTPEILRDAYGEIPPYLTPVGADWTGYPQEWRDRLPQLAGYLYRSGDEEIATGYFTITEQRQYDFQQALGGRGLVNAIRDPLGNLSEVVHDRYDLLPVRVTDAVGLTETAAYNYRVLQPAETIDPNGNRRHYQFTPMGMLQSVAVLGKADHAEGDSLTTPSLQLVYDFRAFMERRQPLSVRTIQRLHHTHDVEVPDAERDQTLEIVEYSDGFGRLLQTRTLAEDITFGDRTFGNHVLPADPAIALVESVGQQRTATDPVNVTVSGWQIYDNKGRVVEKYEPFFSTGWAYAAPQDLEFGQKAMMFYDPRGQGIRTVNPDGSEQRVIYGIPQDLSDPDSFTPTPWESYVYDANDNAGRTHTAISTAYQHHWNTPASSVLDGLGRTIETVQRNGSNPETDWYLARSVYDIRGNLLSVTDALGRIAFRYVYDLANAPLRTENLDAGIRLTVSDAAGNAIAQQDSKGALILYVYDALNRPLRVWARDNEAAPLTLRERMEYGDESDRAQPQERRSAHQQHNRLGKLWQHYDEAGLLTCEAYDFKGNLSEKVRQVIRDSVLLAGSTAAIDWQPTNDLFLAEHAIQLLDPTEYRTSFTYDALSRIQSMRYPEDVNGDRQQLRPRYNRAGALERVELNESVYVERIAYNARRQRSLIAYGNGILTRYAYDPHTFRLKRLRSDRYQQPNSLTYRTTGTPLQDLSYEYDLAGNVLSIQDRIPTSGVINNPQTLQVSDAALAEQLASGNALIRQFEYDPIYRLRSATGRESDSPAPLPPWMEMPRSSDPTRTRLYTERYDYDAVGNLTRLEHQAVGNAYQRQLSLQPNANRLEQVQIGQTVYRYAYDANGNLIQENQSRHFGWDCRDRLRTYRTQAADAAPSVEAHYLYDAQGQRVKKLVRKGASNYEVTVYIDGVFEWHQQVKPSGIQSNNTLHVMDNQSRIALVRVGDAFPDDGAPEVRVKYHLGDHLSSSHVVVSGDGTWINREEYTPYGETSFGSFARKRYRFTGKERDEESDLSYHNARYYAPWLTRWISCDPAGMAGGSNLYAYAANNPLLYVDPSGLAPQETVPVTAPETPSVTTAEPPLPDDPTLATEKHSNASGDIERATVKIRDFEDLYVPYETNCYTAARETVTKHTSEKLVQGAYRSNPARANSSSTYPRLKTFQSATASQRDIVSNPVKAKESLDYMVQTINSGLPVIVGVNESGVIGSINEGVTDHFLVIYGYELSLVHGEWKVTQLYGLDNAVGDYSDVTNVVRRQQLENAAQPVFQVDANYKMSKPGGVDQRWAYQNGYQITQVRFYEKDFATVKNLSAYHGPSELKRK